MDLGDFVRKLSPQRDSDWAWDHYKDAVVSAVRFFGFTSLLEVGGGRTPLFSDREVEALGVQYTVNDIAPEELSLAPDYVEKRCYDIAGDIPESGRYDLVFSKLVFEHIADSRKAYANIYSLLRPGGMVLNFHPTLYAPPFVLNKLLPEAMALRLLRVVYPAAGRTARKFPAHYSWCYATVKADRMLRSVGFPDVTIVPFYGYNYVRNIPVVRTLDQAFADLVAALDFRPLAAFAYTLARK